MKAEINNENKVKFFMLYYGQRVLKFSQNAPATQVVERGMIDHAIRFNFEEKCLSLNPLSSITDEDAIEVAKICRKANMDDQTKEVCIDEGRKVAMNFTLFNLLLTNTTLLLIDFLRSRSYALPWMGLSVDELIEAGWVKLDEK